MKKIWALIVVLALVCSFAVALSEETLELDRVTKTGNTTVSLTVNAARDTYIVVIPSKVEIDPVTQYGEGTITLKSGWELISVNGLDVKLTKAANGIGTGYYSSSGTVAITVSDFQNFKMKSEAGDVATYAIKPSNFSAPMHAYNSTYKGYYSNNLISINKGGDNSKDISSTLSFYVQKMPPAGVYTDTLTFSIITR